MEYTVELTLESPFDYIRLRSELSPDTWEVILPREDRGRGGPAALAKRILFLRKKDLKKKTVKNALIEVGKELLKYGIAFATGVYGNGDGKIVVIEKTKVEINIGGDVIFKDDSTTIEKLQKIIDE